MNRSPDLTPDQLAVLSLLLRQHKSYAQVAGMLAIEEQAVRDRAYAAIGTLGSGEGTSLLRSHREEIGDYLLGQLEDLSASTRSYLLTLANARAWADAVRSELALIATESLPELPADEDQAPAHTPQQQSSQSLAADLPTSVAAEQHPTDPQRIPSPVVSRRGGALLLTAILIVVIVAVVLIVNGGSKGTSSPSASTASSSTSSTTSSSSTPSIQPENQINLTAPKPGSSAKGIVEVGTDEGKFVVVLIAEGLEPTPTRGFFYVLWLINSEGKAKVIGKVPVNSSGEARVLEQLPGDAGSYDRIEITREANEHATQRGPIVLSGSFSLHAKRGASDTSPSTSSTSSTGTGTGTGKPKLNKTIALTPVEPTLKATGTAYVLSENGRYAFYVVAQGLPVLSGSFYAAWLYNSPSSSVPLGKAPPVNSQGHMEGGAPLPSNAGLYHQLIITRETSAHATHPGNIVLRGTFALN